MSDDITSKGDADAGSALLTDSDDLADDLTDIDGDDEDDEDLVVDGPTSSGAVSGGFGFAGLALALVSLTTNWTSEVVVSHSQYSQEMNAPSTGLTVQQGLDMYANSWHTQGWWALAFAGVAVLFGAGALLLPGIRSGKNTPGWAKAAASGAIIVGLVGVILAVLTIVGVLGGHLTAPVSAG